MSMAITFTAIDPKFVLVTETHAQLKPQALTYHTINLFSTLMRFYCYHYKLFKQITVQFVQEKVFSVCNGDELRDEFLWNIIFPAGILIYNESTGLVEHSLIRWLWREEKRKLLKQDMKCR